MKRNLVLLDTDHIKQYVFATDKLKEIRGASALLDELNRIDMQASAKSTDPKAETVYANGGAGMFWVADEHPEKLIHQVQQHYRKTTVTGSITGVSVSETEAENDQHLLQRLFLDAQIAKAEPPCIQTLVTHPFLKHCESCGNEYAVRTDADTEDAELLCQSCFNKRDRDIKIKGEIRKEIKNLIEHQEQKQPSSQKLWDIILFGVKDRLKEFEDNILDRPNDLNQLGDMSSPSNYIALIYADGNNMGTIIDNLSVTQLGKFSTTVDNAIRKAVVDAICGPLWPGQGETCFPFDILLLGGDDLVMVTTANKAIDAAITITKSFYKNTEPIRDMVKATSNEHGPTLSVSVVFVHAKFPFATSLSLAESALKFTKKELANLKRKRPPVTPEGMMNFMVVHSSNTLDFSVLYDQELCDKTQRVYRTLRPYPIDQMERLYKAVKHTLKGVPKTKLHQIREAIFLDKQRATLSTFAALLRAKEHDKQEILNVVKAFAGEARLEYPWYAVEGQKHGETREDEQEKKISYYTPLLDAIELYDFIDR